MLDSKLYSDFSLTTDKMVTKYANFLLMGDMNLNMLDDQKFSI